MSRSILHQTTTNSLVHHLSSLAKSQPNKLACVFLKDGLTEDRRWTYSELYQRARTIGAALQDRCTSGDRALLLFPPGLDFVSAFYGCLYAGVIAIPAPSIDPRLSQLPSRLYAIAADSQASLVLTTTPLLESERNVNQHLTNQPKIPWVSLEDLESSQPDQNKEVDIRGEHLAYLQYTSGATSSPKGVMITHKNVLSQCADFSQAGQYDTDSVSVNWMPHFHDYGLVQGILLPLYMGIPAYIISPLTFLKRPLNWLEAMSRFGGTHSGGPNFAYEHCVQKTTEGQRSSLNLQQWRMASCGAEPVKKETIDRFSSTFRPYGFRPEAFHPGYGLAEFTLMVSIKDQTELPCWEEVDGSALEKNTIIPASGNRTSSSRIIVGCGKVSSKTHVAIVNPHTLITCASHEVGEIWLSSPSVAHGYWNRPQETQETFKARLTNTGEGPFLRTGDLGFMKEGQLFVTGRLKEMMIIRGRNHYPQDIEQTVTHSHPLLRRERTAAFSSEIEGVERVVILQEIPRKIKELEMDKIAGLIRHHVMANHDLQPHAVVFVGSGSLPKTSSGKIQRHACLASYLKGEFAIRGSSLLNLPSQQEPEPGGEYDYHHIQKILPLEEHQNFLEGYLCKKLAQRLKVNLQHVHPTHSLSSLGLDSLLAVELRNQIEFDLGIAVPLSTILGGASVADLAKALERVTRVVGNTPTKPLVPHPKEGFFPLSFAQEGFWILNEFNPGNPIHTIRLQFQVTGSLNLTILEKSVNQIVERHESLRTTFQHLNGRLMQVVATSMTVPVLTIDVQPLSTTQKHEHVRDAILKESNQGFDLEQGPLIRVTVITLSSQESVLLFSFHHIVFDWRSAEIFLNELSIMYRGLTEGCDPSSNLSPLPIQYPDYAIWQRQYLQGIEGERLLGHWRKKLWDAPNTIDLPDRALSLREPPSHQPAGSFVLPVDHFNALKELSQREEATLFMVLVTAFFVLLFRYTHQTDLTIGTPVANRGRQEVDGLIGVFINSLVLRIDMTGNPAFRKLLQRTKLLTLEAYDHQAFPFELLVKELNPVRHNNRNPLFQVLFDFQSSLDHHLELPGLTTALLPHDLPGTQFDLTMSLVETPNGVEGCLEYNSDVFDSGFVQNMLGHFPKLIESVIINPDEPISTLSILSQSDKHQMLDVWSGAATSTRLELHAGIHELFQYHVTQTPDAIAVVHQNERLTYKELNSRANQLARFLQRKGVGSETLVGLCVQRGWELAVSILGILKAGGAYVPIDPNYPTERIHFILNDTSMPVILTQSWIKRDCFTQRDQLVELDSDRDQIGQCDKTNLPSSTAPEALAYVLYTSGSTGMPKGVMGTHKGLVQAYHAWEQAYELSTRCRNHFQMANVVFDVFTGDFVRALCSGGKLVLCPEDLALSPQLLDVIYREHIDIVEMVPATMRYVIRYLEERQQKLDQLKLWIIGSDRWNMEEFYRLRKFCSPDTRIVNSYGLTEATVDSTYFEQTDYALEGHRPVPIGKPMSHTTVFICDEQLGPVPPYVKGELYIGGAGVARGYLNRPELTAERFIHNPFSPNPESYVYKTGDAARFLGDGNIEFLGRQDHQVKVNAYRIEVGEIEHGLRHHGSIKEVVVITRKDKFENDILVAYIVALESISTPTPNDIRQFLEEKLPAYMIPPIIVFLDHLPLTPSGKINRQALPFPEQPESIEKTAYQAPRTKMEHDLVEIWENVLETAPVGVQDDFFHLGGYSMLAVSLFHQIEKLTGRTLPLSTLFQHSTIEEMAKMLSGDAVSTLMKAVVPIQRSGHKPPLFVVHLIGGNVLSFAELSKLMSPDQPLYGLQSIGLDGQEEPLNQIQDMATRYIQEIQLVQPHGPYYLVGGCMGGVVAFEIAQQLTVKGHAVAFLGLVESWLPDSSEERNTWNIEVSVGLAYFIKAVESQIRILRQTDFRQWFRYGAQKMKGLAPMVKTMDIYKGNTAARNHDRVTRANTGALSQYRPKPYSGRMTYFLASARTVPFSKDPRLKWGNYARKGFKVIRIPAPSAGQMFMDPHVKLLSTQLMKALDQAQGENKS